MGGKVRRGRPPRTAPLPRPWLRHRLSPACGTARVRAGFVERGREAVAPPPFRVAGGGTPPCRLGFPSIAAGSPALPKLWRRRAYRQGCEQRLRVRVPIRRYAPRRARLRRKWRWYSGWQSEYRALYRARRGPRYSVNSSRPIDPDSGVPKPKSARPNAHSSGYSGSSSDSSQVPAPHGLNSLTTGLWSAPLRVPFASSFVRCSSVNSFMEWSSRISMIGMQPHQGRPRRAESRPPARSGARQAVSDG